MKLLLDTNVWLDNYIADRSRHPMVAKLLSVALGQGHDLLYTVPSIKDIYYLIAKAYKESFRMQGTLTQGSACAINEVAWACTENMTRIATAVGSDMSDVWLAQKYKSLHPDLEDDLILAAAQRSKADYLVTSDERLLKKAPCAALDPADMLEVLALGSPHV